MFPVSLSGYVMPPLEAVRYDRGICQWCDEQPAQGLYAGRGWLCHECGLALARAAARKMRRQNKIDRAAWLKNHANE